MTLAKYGLNLHGWRAFFVLMLPACWIIGLLGRSSINSASSTGKLRFPSVPGPWGKSPPETHKQSSTPNKNQGDATKPGLAGKPPAPRPESGELPPPPPPQQQQQVWGGHSIRPVAYVFPQFHPIPENDEFWGENFTDWVNVQKVTENMFGLETLRPSPEVGYYNLLDYPTRARYAKLVRESGLYGLVYHHYWFGGPVMHKPLQAILDDGQPDVPFMISWANEPWTIRWDGLDLNGGDGTLLAQIYGEIDDWKRHFDWLAPFFRHKKYIRSNGNVQMMVYLPVHMGDKGKRMFSAWRRWAAEDPTIGGLDVIETRILADNPNERGTTDAMNEFGSRSGGGHDPTLWPLLGRLSRVYHRGARVLWDSTPRHATDGRATATVWAHPELFRVNMIELMRRVKLDPNPIGQENFVFVNSLNEWGEGNALEPSVQWGDGFSKAMRAAKEFADEKLPWTDDLIKKGERLAAEVRNETSIVDVCVVIREFDATWPFSIHKDLGTTLRSLQAQKNKRWRAVVVPARSDQEFRKMNVHVLDSYDPRIVAAEPPPEVLATTMVPVGAIEGESDGVLSDGSEATDWAIENIGTISPSCGNATYMLVTKSKIAYEPHTFDIAGKHRGDILGLNFISAGTMELADRNTTETTGGIAWDQRCDRMENSTVHMCHAMTLDSEILDFGAALIDLQKWRSQNLSFISAVERYGKSTSILLRLAQQAEGPWTWVAPQPNTECQVVHPDSYTACIRAGMMWLDVETKNGFKPGCFSEWTLPETYGWNNIPTRWDYERFKRTPFCVRMSQSAHEKLMIDPIV